MSGAGLRFAQSIVVLSIFWTTEAISTPCNVEVSPGVWSTMITSDQDAQQSYLTKLTTCSSNDAGNQEAIDALAVASISALNNIPPGKQATAASFVAEVLLINAKAGYPSSQHNYAVLFNAPPGSFLAKLIAQDQMKFGDWTRKAAAQGEPRAIFNLAMRMAIGVPEAGIQKDEETAYKLLAILERLATETTLKNDVKVTLQEMRPFIAGTKTKLTRVLGEERAKQAAAAADNFDLSTLAKKELTPNNWDHEKNIRAAVQDFLQTQDSLGNEAVVRKTLQCYMAAKGESGLTMKREYCVAFDAANIEMTTAFYQRMAEKYKTANAQSLQPMATTRPVGRRRIIDEMMRANVADGELAAKSIYKQAIAILIDVATRKRVQQSPQ